MFKQVDTVKLPSWAVCYLINGDSSYLEEDETDMIDSWIANTMEQWNLESLTFDIEETEEEDFTSFPEFGLACDTLTTHLWGNIAA